MTLDDGPVTTSAGYAVLPTHPNTVLAHADTIVVPGINGDIVETGVLPDDLAALAATARPRRAVALDLHRRLRPRRRSGKLDGREATTHWCHADALPPALPRRSCSTPTCSTSTTATSSPPPATPPASTCCSTCCARDLGTEAANRVARGAVVAPWRAGGQAQFIERPVPDESDAGTGPTRAWVLEHLDEPIDPVRRWPRTRA